MPQKIDNADAVIKGVRDSWDFWLSDHPITVPDCIEIAIEKAFRAWLDDNGEEILKRLK